MSRWELIDTAVIPKEGGEMRLYRRQDEFSIRISGRGELMNSRTRSSEDALGVLPCKHLVDRSDAHVLVGGLGMGFTLAAALTCLASDAKVVVAELVPRVVRWNEGQLGERAGRPLRDARVRVLDADVGTLIQGACDEYDAILLDVDNGPEGLTHQTNNHLYSLSGLADTYRALRVQGTLAVWSAGPDPSFTARLQKIGFSVDERRVRARVGKGARHVIWLATRDV